MRRYSSALEALQQVFGYDAFRGFQKEVVETVVSGEDALVLMPTGGGKSLCYQIPALLRDGVAIVVSPLIALMHDQVDALEELGVRAAYLNSTLLPEEAVEVRNQVRRGVIDLLYVSPERLLMSSMLSFLKELRISLFAIDEAHCVSIWGHDFRPEYSKLSVLKETFPQVPRIALTATADQKTREEIVEKLLLNPRKFIASFDRPNIFYRIVDKHNVKEQVAHFIRTDHPGECGVVYCLARSTCEDVCEFLQTRGVHAVFYHAGLSSEERAARLALFQRVGLAVEVLLLLLEPALLLLLLGAAFLDFLLVFVSGAQDIFLCLQHNFAFLVFSALDRFVDNTKRLFIGVGDLLLGAFSGSLANPNTKKNANDERPHRDKRSVEIADHTIPPVCFF